MNWKKFFKTLGAVAATGAIAQINTVLTSGQPISGKSIGSSAAVGAVGGILLWLRSPADAVLPAPQDPPKV